MCTIKEIKEILDIFDEEYIDYKRDGYNKSIIIYKDIWITDSNFKNEGKSSWLKFIGKNSLQNIENMIIWK